MLLKAKMIVHCPKTNSEVEVSDTCLDKGNKCRHYSHMSYIGLKPHVSCLYPKFKTEGDHADE